MSDAVLDLLDDDLRELLAEESPHLPGAMLATLTDDHFAHPDWVYERKLDGQRVLAVREDGQARLRSRNDLDLDDTYPELVDALSGDGPDLVVDGEVVAFEGDVTSFSRLQQRMQLRDAERARASGVAVRLYLFDLLHLDGWSTRDLPLRDRKRLLRAAVEFEDPVRFTSHRNEDGPAFLDDACRRGWEGLIAKDASAPYRSGRSRDWLKFKCVHQQELVVGGFTAPKGSRTRFGALLVGYHEDGALRYAGKVGTGYDRETLDRVGDLLDARTRKTSPFDDHGRERDATWVTPDLVAEIGFTEWTEDGRLRHPRFLGLRDDKDAADVVRERPA